MRNFCAHWPVELNRTLRRLQSSTEWIRLDRGPVDVPLGGVTFLGTTLPERHAPVATASAERRPGTARALLTPKA